MRGTGDTRERKGRVLLFLQRVEWPGLVFLRRWHLDKDWRRWWESQVGIWEMRRSCWESKGHILEQGPTESKKESYGQWEERQWGPYCVGSCSQREGLGLLAGESWENQVGVTKASRSSPAPWKESQYPSNGCPQLPLHRNPNSWPKLHFKNTPAFPSSSFQEMGSLTTQLFRPDAWLRFWFFSFPHTLVHLINKFYKPYLPSGFQIWLLLCSLLRQVKWLSQQHAMSEAQSWNLKPGLLIPCWRENHLSHGQ